jgi:hypothetical protein
LNKISIDIFVYHDLGYWQEHTIGGNDFFMTKLGHLAIKRGPEKAPKDILEKIHQIPPIWRYKVETSQFTIFKHCCLNLWQKYTWILN